MQEHPGQLAISGMADALGAQAWPIGTTIGIGSVALGAVPKEKLMACCDGLLVLREGVLTGAVFIRNAMQPFTIEHSRLSGGDGNIASYQECQSAGDHDWGKAERSEFVEAGWRMVPVVAADFLSAGK